MKCRYFLVIAIAALFLSCNNNSGTASFNVYMINDPDMSISEFDSTNIQDIELPPNPVLTITDICQYTIVDYDGLSLSHRVSINDHVHSVLGNSNSLFVLVVNGERKYKGEYWANFMNTYPLDVTFWASSDSIFTIMAHDAGRDKINDPGIINTLSDHGIDVLYDPLY